MNQENQEINLFIKSLKTIFEMANDRGYNNNYYPNKQIIQEQYNQFNSNSSVFDIHFINEQNRKLIITFLNQNELDNKQQILEKIIILTKIYRIQQNDDILLIYNNNSIEKKINLENLYSFQNLNTRILSMQFLQFNVSRNKLVPKHEKVQILEINNLQKNYRLQSLRQLPFIYISDPQCKYHGFRSNDVIKIIRISRTNTKSISYRLVVDNEDDADNYDTMFSPSYSIYIPSEEDQLSEESEELESEELESKELESKELESEELESEELESEELEEPSPTKCPPDKIKKCKEKNKICNEKTGRCNNPPKRKKNNKKEHQLCPPDKIKKCKEKNKICNEKTGRCKNPPKQKSK